MKISSHPALRAPSHPSLFILAALLVSGTVGIFFDSSMADAQVESKQVQTKPQEAKSQDRLEALAVESAAVVAKGVVFEDLDRDGIRDENEPGLAGVRVSNGLEIVSTDENGAYRLPLSDDQIVFVIKPDGFGTRLNKDQLPQFYYIHKPAGSPQLQYPGVPPTGPLPSSIDFPLYRQQEPENFRAILFGDPQPRNLEEVSYIAEDVIPDVIGTDASFGVTLGDIVFDDLTCFQAVNETYGLIGIPWYNVIGNHDINYDVKERKYANETFERFYGPSYYSFDYGKVHFVVTDNINYHIDPADGKGKYDAKFGEDQLQFIRNDLAAVPEKSLVVLLMHIPLIAATDRHELYRIIEQRPFCISISGHTHFHAHRFIDNTDDWRGSKPHHHIINVTVSGSWWGGSKDERGIPHTTMSDGAPNGHSVIAFNNTTYQLDFVPAGRPKTYQMELSFPDEVTQDKSEETELVANVFNGTPVDKVEARVGVSGQWQTMENFEGVSPMFETVYEIDRNAAGEPLITKPGTTQHLWKIKLGKLQAGFDRGHHLVQVRWTDRNNRQTIGNRVLRIVEGPSGVDSSAVSPSETNAKAK